MKLLVTGGAGFIGSNYVKMILSEELPGVSSVIVLDKFTYAGNVQNLSPCLQDPRLDIVKGDICDKETVKKIVSKVDAVVNFAAESHVDNSISGAKPFFDTNVLGTLNLLESVRDAKVNRFLQVSTDEVYGSIHSGSWDENEPLMPNSPYSASKASADLLTRSFSKTYGLDTVITRCSNNYGHNQHPEKLIPLFITNLLEKKKVPVYGTGKNIRDWLHVSDHCRGIHLALTKGNSGEIYNIGGGTELTNLAITKIILESLGLDESYIDFVEDRKGHDLRYSVNCSKAQKELGYRPEIEFESGIQSTITWYQENENWWRPLLNK